MNAFSVALVAVTLLVVPPIWAADTQGDWVSACSKRIVSPTYPSDALKGKLAGTVSATFTIDTGGIASRMKTEGPKMLADAVESAINKTRFPQPCKGRSIASTFELKVRGELPAESLVSVCFLHPSRFFVIASDKQIVCGHSANVGALTADRGLQPVTVCELLADPMAFHGKDIALLGRSGTTDEGWWLGEDNCEQSIKTGEYVWPNFVSVEWSSDSAPDTPMGLLVLDRTVLSKKLASVRQTTTLKTEKRWVLSFGPKGHHLADVKQSWAVVYGRIETRHPLRPPTGRGFWSDWGNGFGHLSSAPVQIVMKQDNSVYIRED